MRSPRFLFAALAGTAAIAVLVGTTSASASAAGPNGRLLALGRATLAPDDGWGASGTGTTGGSAATADHIYTVTNRAQLVAALGGYNATNGTNTTPKIIFVKGTIDANTDATGKALTCDDYATDGYTLAGYLAAYDPAVWGRTAVPSGPLEDARDASQKKQGAQVQIHVGSNTTLIGVGNATLLGANLYLNKVDNVIVRNITFSNAYDCFPQWDPTDGSTGNWNSEYDNVSLFTSTHVWVDHDTFTDGSYPDSAEPTYFDRPFQQHDGELDITKASDLVTAEWNHFTNHDKTSLIGSSNSATADIGHLRVTLHHNFYDNVLQRTPRVRFGQVHVYNNLYRVSASSAAEYVYSWGVGVRSGIYAENNAFLLDSTVPAAQIIYNWGGLAIHETGTLVNGKPVDVLAAFNAANPTAQLGSDVGWTPTLHQRVDPTRAVPGLVACGSGAGHLK